MHQIPGIDSSFSTELINTSLSTQPTAILVEEMAHSVWWLC